MAESVFYDLADTPEEAANLTARGLLMIAIEQRVREENWTQAQAAQMFHVTQPRVSDLLNGKIDKFSLDALVNMLPAVGLTIDVQPASRPKRSVIPDSRQPPHGLAADAAPRPRKAQRQAPRRVAAAAATKSKARG